MSTRNYTLRYAKAQEFYGYETPADVLVAMANFDNEHGNQTHSVNLSWAEGSGYGGTLTWEDFNA